MEMKTDGSTTIFITAPSVLFFGIDQFTWERLDVNKRDFGDGDSPEICCGLFLYFLFCNIENMEI